jgi:multidrug resistance protein, MATE family
MLYSNTIKVDAQIDWILLPFSLALLNKIETCMLNSRYPITSLRQLLLVSIPLVLTVLSVHTMLLVDRIVVSQYDVAALSPITMAGNFCAIFQICGVLLASIAEVFVGQYHGAKKAHLIASPVWQMIWLSFALFIISIPMSLYGGGFFLKEEFLKYGNPYYKVCMFFAPITSMISALSAFYIGRGKVIPTTVIVILGNTFNILLDIVMVFGWKEVPSFGPVGAAYATVISSVFQAAVLFAMFLSRKNRIKYNTGFMQFDFNLFKRCLKIGFPNALGESVEVFGWFSVLLITSHLGGGYSDIQSMTQNIIIFFMFFTDGVSKGVCVVASNMLGAKKINIMNKLLSSGIRLNGAYLACLSIPLVFYPELVLKVFFGDLSVYSQYFVDQSILALRYSWGLLFLDGLFWVGAGILVAGGDTLFLTAVNALTIWIFSIMPIIIAVKFFDVSPSSLWMIMGIYKLVALCAIFIRYRSKKWVKLTLDLQL